MPLTVDGATRLHLIIGDPIAQVRSPAGISASFQRRGANALVVPAHITSGDVDGVLASAKRIGNVDGIIATIPHKFALLAHATRKTSRAETLGAANLLRREADGGWLAEMSDGLGQVGALRKAGADPKGRRALLVGAGGAGSAIALALLDAGVASLAIYDADAARRDALIKRLGPTASGRAIAARSNDPAGADLVVNATPAGMKAGDPMPVAVERLALGTAVGCVITTDGGSPFVAAARAKGLTAATGLDMFHAQVEIIADFLLGGPLAA